jgi:hypothetical protein
MTRMITLSDLRDIELVLGGTSWVNIFLTPNSQPLINSGFIYATKY